MAESWIGQLASELGLNFGAVYPTAGEDGTLPQKGEIEVFASKAGHVTKWHLDFMENFTLQLRGRKRWLLRRSTLQHPLRGYTPHYKTHANLLQQLQVHRMQVWLVL